jgi:hypothetical protein
VNPYEREDERRAYEATSREQTDLDLSVTEPSPPRHQPPLTTSSRQPTITMQI